MLLTHAQSAVVQSLCTALITPASSPTWSRWCQDWQALDQYLADQHQEDTTRFAQQAYPASVKDWVAEQRWAVMPIVKMFAGTLSVTFDVPPSTRLRRRGQSEPLPESDPQVQQWRRDAAAIDLPSTLQALERRVTALRNVVLCPTWVGTHIRWISYGPQEVRVLKSSQDPSDLSRARAVAFLVRRTDNVFENEWLVWALDETSGQRYAVRTNHLGTILGPALFEGGIHPYGLHPAVLWQWGSPNAGEIFLPPQESLLSAQRLHNTGRTDLHRGMAFYAHPIPVVHGMPNNVESDEIPISPGVPLQFGGDRNTTGLEFKTPTLNVEHHRNTLEWDLQQLAVMNDLPPDTFASWSALRNASAMQEKASELDRVRDQRIPVVARCMARTFEAHVAVANTWTLILAAHGDTSRVLYDPDVELLVEFAPRRKVEDRQAAAQAMALELPYGLTSPTEVVMARSGVAREEAEAIIRRRQDELDQLAVRQAYREVLLAAARAAGTQLVAPSAPAPVPALPA